MKKYLQSTSWSDRMWSIFKIIKFLMTSFIRERMSDYLYFDIGDISQPFHQRCSELATEERSGILTSLLLKTVLLDIPWLLSLRDIANLVFDVFFSLIIDRMWSFWLVFCKYYLNVAYYSVHMQRSENRNQLVDVSRSIHDYAKDGGPRVVWPSCSFTKILCGVNFCIR